MEEVDYHLFDGTEYVFVYRPSYFVTIDRFLSLYNVIPMEPINCYIMTGLSLNHANKHVNLKCKLKAVINSQLEKRKRWVE